MRRQGQCQMRQCVRAEVELDPDYCFLGKSRQSILMLLALTTFDHLATSWAMNASSARVTAAFLVRSSLTATAHSIRSGSWKDWWPRGLLTHKSTQRAFQLHGLTANESCEPASKRVGYAYELEYLRRDR